MAVFAGRHYLQAREAELQVEARVGLEGRAVIVAAHPLTAGTTIGPTDLASRQVPGRFADSESLGPDAAGQLLGRRVLRSRRAGDPISLRDVESPDAVSLSSRVEPGMRAVTLPVDELGSLSGLLRPGDHVDLYFLPSNAGNDARIGLLLPGVLVLATGAQTRLQSAATAWQSQSSAFASITVQLSPDDAERLSLAQRVGQLVPVLRRGGDTSPTVERIRSAHSLLTPTVSQHSASRRTPEVRALEVILGGRGEGLATTGSLLQANGERMPEGAQP